MVSSEVWPTRDATVGRIPWSALIGIDDLAYDIAQAGSTPQLAALWKRFNGDAVMLTYLLMYVIGRLRQLAHESEELG